MRTTTAIILAGIACIMLVAAGCTSSPATPSATTVTTAVPAATTATAEPTTAATTAVPAAANATGNASAPAVSATATAPANVTPAHAAVSWNGTWNTTYSAKDAADVIELVTLTQAGTSVTGTYGHGNGTILATMKESKLTGTWNETDSTGTYAGFFVFEKSADDKSFRGFWVNTADGESALSNTTQTWNGVRV